MYVLLHVYHSLNLESSPLSTASLFPPSFLQKHDALPHCVGGVCGAVVMSVKPTVGAIAEDLLLESSHKSYTASSAYDAYQTKNPNVC